MTAMTNEEMIEALSALLDVVSLESSDPLVARARAAVSVLSGGWVGTVSEAERLRNALVKVRAHTGYLPAAPYELLAGLIASIERIADAALSSPTPAPTADVVASQETLDGVTVAGARAFWAMRDIEAKHEALRAAVMTVYSDPHLTWEQARNQLAAALSSPVGETPNKETK